MQISSCSNYSFFPELQNGSVGRERERLGQMVLLGSSNQPVAEQADLICSGFFSSPQEFSIFFAPLCFFYVKLPDTHADTHIHTCCRLSLEKRKSCGRSAKIVDANTSVKSGVAFSPMTLLLYLENVNLPTVFPTGLG